MLLKTSFSIKEKKYSLNTSPTEVIRVRRSLDKQKLGFWRVFLTVYCWFELITLLLIHRFNWMVSLNDFYNSPKRLKLHQKNIKWLWKARVQKAVKIDFCVTIIDVTVWTLLVENSFLLKFLYLVQKSMQCYKIFTIP